MRLPISFFDTILAFGDSFSSQCGLSPAHCESLVSFDSNAVQQCTVRARHAWIPDLGVADDIHGRAIHKACAANGGWNFLNYLTGCTTDGADPLECPVKLVDLAFGGAQAYDPLLYEGTAVSTADQISAISLEDQVYQFTNLVNPQLAIVPGSTLVSVFVGINDIAFLSQRRVIDPELKILGATRLLMTQRIDNLLMSLDLLRLQNFQNFLILNVPAVANWIDESEEMALLWNSILQEKVTEWSANFLTSVNIVDVHSLYQDMLTNPSTYGFDDVESSCFDAESGHAICDEKSKYLRMDFVHWTPHAHLHLASLIKKQIGPIICPRSLSFSSWYFIYAYFALLLIVLSLSGTIKASKTSGRHIVLSRDRKLGSST